MLEGYRGKIQKGDVVRMPSGVLATIKDWDIVCGGNAMVAWLKPHTGWWKRFVMAFTGESTVADKKIDELVLITPAATDS